MRRRTEADIFSARSSSRRRTCRTAELMLWMSARVSRAFTGAAVFQIAAVVVSAPVESLAAVTARLASSVEKILIEKRFGHELMSAMSVASSRLSLIVTLACLTYAQKSSMPCE